MATRNENNVLIEDAEIGYLNFAGQEGQYNRAGDRNFALFLDDEQADAMMKDGWNIKHTKVREEGDIPKAYLSISVSYRHKPPRIEMITSRGRTIMPEAQVEILDWVDIEKVDLIFRPYAWAVGAKSGIKAYLKTMFVKIYEDPLELKYADVPLAIGGQSLAIEANEVVEGEIISDSWEPRQLGG